MLISTHACSLVKLLHLPQTLAEKAAWDLSKKYGFHLVTVNPVFVFGPVLSSRADATSVLMMKVMPHTNCCLALSPFALLTSTCTAIVLLLSFLHNT